MKLFIDSGNLKEIEDLVPLGIIDGITTNPSLLAKEPGDYKEILKKICQIVKGPTSAEVVATDAEGMIREGRELAAIDRAETPDRDITRADADRAEDEEDDAFPRDADALRRSRRSCADAFGHSPEGTSQGL